MLWPNRGLARSVVQCAVHCLNRCCVLCAVCCRRAAHYSGNASSINNITFLPRPVSASAGRMRGVHVSRLAQACGLAVANRKLRHNRPSMSSFQHLLNGQKLG